MWEEVVAWDERVCYRHLGHKNVPIPGKKRHRWCPHGKVTDIQVWGPEFGSPESTESQTREHMSVIPMVLCEMGGRKRKISGHSGSSRPRGTQPQTRKACLRTRGGEGQQASLSCNQHMCTVARTQRRWGGAGLRFSLTQEDILHLDSPPVRSQQRTPLLTNTQLHKAQLLAIITWIDAGRAPNLIQYSSQNGRKDKCLLLSVREHGATFGLEAGSTCANKFVDNFSGHSLIRKLWVSLIN